MKKKGKMETVRELKISLHTLPVYLIQGFPILYTNLTLFAIANLCLLDLKLQNIPYYFFLSKLDSYEYVYKHETSYQ